MKNILALLLLMLPAVLIPAQEDLLPGESRVPLWGLETLKAVRDRVRAGDQDLVPAVAALRREADRLAAGPLVAITDKKGSAAVMPSGDPRDYVSVSIYHWPDPNDPAAPWIWKDGEQNKAVVDLYDTPRLRAMVDRVTTCSLAWWFTGEERYAQAATAQLRVWFLDPATRMNPHFQHAQMIPNKNGGKGSAYGLIDSRFLVEMLSAVGLLESGDRLTPEEQTALRAWFRDFLTWFRTSDLGQKEGQATNNHGLYYDLQVVAYALYVGDRAQAQATVERFGPARIATQVAADGSLPRELARPIAATYTCFALSAMAQMVALARHAGLAPDPWTWTSPEGRSIPQALAWTLPYLEGQEWKHGLASDRFTPAKSVRIYRTIASVTGTATYVDIARARELPTDDRMRLLVPLPTVGR